MNISTESTTSSETVLRIGGGGKQIFRMHLAPSLKTFLPLKALKVEGFEGHRNDDFLLLNATARQLPEERATEGKGGQERAEVEIFKAGSG